MCKRNLEKTSNFVECHLVTYLLITVLTACSTQHFKKKVQNRLKYYYKNSDIVRDEKVVSPWSRSLSMT